MTRKPADSRRIYKVQFVQLGKTYEVYCRGVSQGELFGFIQIEELLFGEKTQVVVDPSEESLKSEFDGVRRFFVPMHAVVRIDEVQKPGAGRITEGKAGAGNVAAFPTPIYTPSGGDKSNS